MSSLQSNKTQKNRRFRRIFHLLFSCISSKKTLDENVIGTSSRLVSMSSQCVTPYSECICEETLSPLPRCGGVLNLTELIEPKAKPLEEQMKFSLQKIDNLIALLDYVYKFYSKKSFDYLKVQTTSELSETALQENCNGVNFCENLDCKKHLHAFNSDSRIMFSKSDCSLICLKEPVVHKCISEYLKFKDSKKYGIEMSETNNDSKRLNNEVTLSEEPSEKTDNKSDLQSSNLDTFSSNVLEHVTKIKTEIEGLKNIFCNINNVAKKQHDSCFSISRDELQEWFENKDSVVKERWFFRSEEYKFFEAKTRASNFCKFYRYNKKFNRSTNI